MVFILASIFSDFIKRLITSAFERLLNSVILFVNRLYHATGLINRALKFTAFFIIFSFLLRQTSRRQRSARLFEGFFKRR